MFIPNSSMVKVWGVSVLVMASLTVCPLATVIVEGLKAANFAVTSSFVPAASGVAVEAGVDVEAGVER